MVKKNNLFKRVGVGVLALFSCFMFMLPFATNTVYAETTTYSNNNPSQEIKDYIINNGYYKSDNLFPISSVSGVTSTRVEFAVPLLAGTYTLSGIGITSDTDDIHFLFDFKTYDGVWLKSAFLSRNVRNSYTFTTTNDIVSVIIYASTTYNKSVGDTFNINEIQLEEGSICTAYKPYKNDRYKEGVFSSIVEKEYNNSYIELKSIVFKNAYNDELSDGTIFYNYEYTLKFNLIKPYSYSMVGCYLYLLDNNGGYVTALSSEFNKKRVRLYGLDGDTSLIHYNLNDTNLSNIEFKIICSLDYSLTDTELIDLINFLYIQDYYLPFDINNSYYPPHNLVYCSVFNRNKLLYDFNNSFNDGFYFYDYFNNSYNGGFDDGYGSGYNKGLYDKTVEYQNSSSTFKDLMFSIFDAPFNVLANTFDFELLGINVGSFLQVIVSLLLIAFAIKIFI